jgi:hypothetical protein
MESGGFSDDMADSILGFIDNITLDMFTSSDTRIHVDKSRTPITLDVG